MNEQLCLATRLFQAGVPVVALANTHELGSRATITESIRRELGIDRLPKFSPAERWQRLFQAWLEAHSSYGDDEFGKALDVELELDYWAIAREMNAWFRSLCDLAPWPIPGTLRLLYAAFGVPRDSVAADWVDEMRAGSIPLPVDRLAVSSSASAYAAARFGRLIRPFVDGRGEEFLAWLQDGAGLTERERSVIELRLGLGRSSSEARDRMQVSRMIGAVTQERIRQIEAKAFRKVRKPEHLPALVARFWGESWRTLLLPIRY